MGIHPGWPHKLHAIHDASPQIIELIRCMKMRLIQFNSGHFNKLIQIFLLRDKIIQLNGLFYSKRRRITETVWIKQNVCSLKFHSYQIINAPLIYLHVEYKIIFLHVINPTVVKSMQRWMKNERGRRFNNMNMLIKRRWPTSHLILASVLDHTLNRFFSYWRPYWSSYPFLHLSLQW